MSLWQLIVGVLAIGILLVVLRQILGIRVIIYDYQRAILYSHGRFQKVLGAGAHWIFQPFQSVHIVDMRSRVVSVPGQEILSADNVSAKISVALRFSRLGARGGRCQRAIIRAGAVS